MRVTVVGAGYVGCVSGACLAKLGHDVLLIDIDPAKVEAVSGGKSPVLEPGLDVLVADMVAEGRLRAGLGTEDSYREADIAVVCVSTPSLESGEVDTGPMSRVFAQIAEVCLERAEPLVVAVRSTVLPGRLRQVVAGLPTEQAQNLRVVAIPEFLRETTAIEDFMEPPFLIVGGDDPEALKKAAGLYDGLEAPLHSVSLETAFLVKYASNAYHALKIGFANEIADFSKHVNGDPLEVMRVFAEDRCLNISKAYLRPGFAFGGSCLPKDVRALVAAGSEGGCELPLLATLLESNRQRIETTAKEIIASGARSVALLGLSFKAGTDDLRESPYLLLAGELRQAGIELRVFDPDVDASALLGANRYYAERYLPELAEVLTESAEQAVDGADALVICKRVATPERLRALAASVPFVVDLEYIT